VLGRGGRGKVNILAATPVPAVMIEFSRPTPFVTRPLDKPRAERASQPPLPLSNPTKPAVGDYRFDLVWATKLACGPLYPVIARLERLGRPADPSTLVHFSVWVRRPGATSTSRAALWHSGMP
jgi:hypothetical protein